MGSSQRLFNRHRTVHQILGGGLVADVVLWRQKNVTIGILLLTLAVWLVFEQSGYTLLSLCSSVLLLLLTILFVWAKSAALLNRPPPPLPDLHLSEELVEEAAALVRSHVNALLSVSKDIALGKDSRLFFRVAAWLLLIFLLGSLTDLVTLGYASLLVLLAIPAFYERYEEQIDGALMFAFKTLHQLYFKLDEYRNMLRKFDLDHVKLD